jgi:tripartite-type tricarboxylate transporter receptor subunit TctC
MRRLPRLILVAVAAFCMSPGTPAQAEEFPSRPIFIVVGPGPDAVARLVGQQMTQDWGQQVLIDPQPATGGMVAARYVAKAAADGYTLLLTTGSYPINEILRPQQSAKLMTDFAPVIEVASLPFVILVPSALPVKSLAELVQLARAKPGEINCASSGVGTTAHLGCVLLNSVAKIDTVHVPYKGLGAVLTDLLAGRVQFTFAVPTATEFVASGQLRALAVTGPKRLATLPDVPTVAEAGFADLQFTSWNGVHVPAGTPAPIIARLNAEIARICALPDFQKRLMELGFAAEGGTADAFGAFVRADLARWEKVVRETGVKLE